MFLPLGKNILYDKKTITNEMRIEGVILSTD